MCIRDRLYDLPRLFDRDPLLNGDLLFHRASGGGFQRAVGQAFQAVSYTHLDVYKRQAKAACIASSDGMAEAMPFQSSP